MLNSSSIELTSRPKIACFGKIDCGFDSLTKIRHELKILRKNCWGAGVGDFSPCHNVCSGGTNTNASWFRACDSVAPATDQSARDGNTFESSHWPAVAKSGGALQIDPTNL